jgi:integrase
MKGIYNANPSRPRYLATWNIDAVTKHLDSLPHDAELGLAAISKKLATLLALTSMLRVSEIASIDRQSVSITDDRASFSLSKPRKAQRVGALHTVSLDKFYNNPKLCPVSCLGHYLQKTDAIRSEVNNKLLFVAMVRPHKPITGSTLGRWIKSMLSDSGVDTSIFKAHSTRGAAASKAAKSGVPIDDILRTAQWSKESTFTRFYHREIAKESISEAILNPGAVGSEV